MPTSPRLGPTTPRRKGGPTAEQRGIANAQVQAAAATLAVLERRLDKTMVRAPADGIVTVRPARAALVRREDLYKEFIVHLFGWDWLANAALFRIIDFDDVAFGLSRICGPGRPRNRDHGLKVESRPGSRSVQLDDPCPDLALAIYAIFAVLWQRAPSRGGPLLLRPFFCRAFLAGQIECAVD